MVLILYKNSLYFLYKFSQSSNYLTPQNFFFLRSRLGAFFIKRNRTSLTKER
jgi:hypothetical protein